MSYEVIGWLIAIVVFIAAEAATVALVSVWFIGGAVCALARGDLGRGAGRAAGGVSGSVGSASGVRLPIAPEEMDEKARAHERPTGWPVRPRL